MEESSLKLWRVSTACATKKTAKTAAFAKVDLARLPPTEDGATLHAYLTYFQIQKWLGVEKDTTQWGWEKIEEGLVATTMMNEVTPF